jgi:hypothetical protein
MGRWVLIAAGLVCMTAQAVERRPGAVATSDGVELRGEVWFGNAEIKVYEGEGASGGKYLKVNQDDLARITFTVKKSTMERPWRFKNAGSDEKEYLEGQYPLVELASEVLLKSGQVLKGHVLTVPVMVRVQGRENPMDFDTHKFPLKYQHKGETGQLQKDIVYVTSIRFDDATGVVAGGKKIVLSGVAKGMGKLQEVVAYSNEHGHVIQGKVDAKLETFSVEAPPGGKYDLAILTDRSIYVGLSDQVPESKEPPRALEDGDLKSIAAEVVKFRDFFEDQKVVSLKGNRDAAKALLLQTRVASVNDQAALSNKVQHRLDIWRWHLMRTEWRVDTSARANLFRYEDTRGERPRDVRFVAKLGAVSAESSIKLDVEEKDAAEFPASEIRPIPGK